jgi:hypothetical protein
MLFGSFDYDYTHIFFIMVISTHPILFLYHNIWVKLLKWKTWIWWPKNKMVVLALVSHELMSVNVCHIHKSQVFVQRRKPLIHVLSLVYWRFGNKTEYHHWFINNHLQCNFGKYWILKNMLSLGHKIIILCGISWRKPPLHGWICKTLTQAIVM